MHLVSVAVAIVATLSVSVYGDGLRQGGQGQGRDKDNKQEWKGCKRVGPVGQGLKCGKKESGLTCPSGKASCSAYWNPNTKTCEDSSFFLPCTCDGNTWNCAAVKCAPPDSRCSCDAFNVAPGEFCYGDGGTCPYGKPFTCPDVYDESTGSCRDVSISAFCDCYQGQWICAMPSCMAPDSRCNCDGTTVAPGEWCFGEGGSCPYQTTTCAGVYDEKTGTCGVSSFETSCFCSGGTWICAVADCAPYDPRCLPEPEKQQNNPAAVKPSN